MATSDASKRATKKYRKEHLKPIYFEVQKEEFTLVIEPAIKASGLCQTEYIKLALKEKIERDKNEEKSQHP